MHTVSKNVHQPKPVCFDTLSMQLNEACTYAALEVVCGQHSHLASQHPLGIASLSAADPVFTTDVDAASVFPKDTPRLTPLAIAGDGNCLPRCASVLVYGDEEHHNEMRARIILELVLAQEFYLDESFLQDGCQGSNVLATYSMFSGQVVPTPFVQNSAQSVMREEIMDMRKASAYMGDLAITCLGQHCRRSPVFTVPNFAEFLVREHLHRRIYPRQGSTRDVPSAGILWTHSLGKFDSKKWSPKPLCRVCNTNGRYGYPFHNI